MVVYNQNTIFEQKNKKRETRIINKFTIVRQNNDILLEANKFVKINQSQFQKVSSLSKDHTRHAILLVFRTLTVILSDNNEINIYFSMSSLTLVTSNSFV
jgi:hypothetical protein